MVVGTDMAYEQDEETVVDVGDVCTGKRTTPFKYILRLTRREVERAYR